MAAKRRAKAKPGGKGKQGEWGGQAVPVKETDITKAIRDLLRAMGVFHWKFSPGPFGNQAGISDILGIWNKEKGKDGDGLFLAIEVKKPGGRVSPAQTRFLDNVRANGGIGILAYCVEDVIKGLGLEDRVLC